MECFPHSDRTRLEAGRDKTGAKGRHPIHSAVESMARERAMDAKSKIDLYETNPHMALDVAVEIVAIGIAKATRAWHDAEQRGDDEGVRKWHAEFRRLVEIRDELYDGNEKTIQAVLDEATTETQEETAG